jgi:type IV fimbrial biogenesis protein FimT
MRGFTILELLIGVAVAAILTMVAAPSLRDLANEMRLRSMASQVVSDLNFARLEAVKRNARVLVCPKAAATDTCAAATTNWQNGWLVCYDANSDDACDATSATDPNPMKIAGALNATLTLTNSSTARIRFNPVGTANSAAVLTLKGTWTGSGTHTASVAATGYITSAKN